MSEPLAVLARFLQTFNEEGFTGLEDQLTPDFEFHEPPEQPGATIFRGRAEALVGFARWAESWEEQRSEPRSADDLPNGRILAFTVEHLRGRDGLEVANDCGHLITLRGEKLRRWQCFWDPANARRAAGLD